MRKIMFWALLVCAGASAQDMKSLLRDIEKNNIELQSILKGNEAAVMELKSENSLEDPSVEYSPFWRKSYSGVASSELIVKQGFDFPSLYAARSRSGKFKSESLAYSYEDARMNLLLSAQKLCLDIVYQNKLREVLDQRLSNSSQLMALYEKKLEAGDGTILQVNKIKMDRMTVQTEIARSDAAVQNALQELLALNGNLPVSFSSSEYEMTPADWQNMLDNALANDYALKAAKSAELASAQDLKAARQGWTPKFEVGYRRNTELKESLNGFVVGVSLPIFSNSKKVKAASARHSSDALSTQSQKLALEDKVRAQINEFQILGRTLETYDLPLMLSTVDVLKKSVESGAISILEYYTQADAVYEKISAFLELERQYQGLAAELNKYSL